MNILRVTIDKNIELNFNPLQYSYSPGEKEDRPGSVEFLIPHDGLAEYIRKNMKCHFSVEKHVGEYGYVGRVRRDNGNFLLTVNIRSNGKT